MQFVLVREPIRRVTGYLLLQEFSGRWVVEPSPNGLSTLLRYEISVVPKMSIPSTFVSHIVRMGLPTNVSAIAERAEQVNRLLSGNSSAASDQAVKRDLPMHGPGRWLLVCIKFNSTSEGGCRGVAHCHVCITICCVIKERAISTLFEIAAGAEQAERAWLCWTGVARGDRPAAVPTFAAATGAAAAPHRVGGPPAEGAVLGHRKVCLLLMPFFKHAAQSMSDLYPPTHTHHTHHTPHTHTLLHA